MRFGYLGCFLMGLVALASSVSATTHTVLVQNFEFVPADITIVEGDTVHWELVSGTHTVTSGSGCTSDGGFDSGLLGGAGFDQTFSTAGTTEYFCAISTHCASLGMEGSVEVVAAGGGTSAPAGGIGLLLVSLVAAASGGVMVLRRRALA